MTVVMWSGDDAINYTDRFVDPTNGNDSNDGLTLATAWQTLAKVAADGQTRERIRLPGGQTIALTETFQVPASTMAFSTWGPGRCVLDGVDTYDCFNSNGQDNLFLENIETTQGLDFGFAFDGVSNITLVDCSAHDCGNDQLIFSDCDHCEVFGGSYHNAYTRLNDDRVTSGIEVKDSCSYITIDGVECYGNMGVASPAHWSAGIAIHAHSGTVLAHHVTVRNCYIHDGGLNCFGIRVNNANAATMTDRAIVIDGNTIIANAYGGIRIDSSAGATYPVNGVTIRNNVSRLNTTQYQLSIRRAQNVRAYRNILANNNNVQSGQNLLIEDSQTVVFANNTLNSFYDNFWYSVYISGASCSAVVLRNNTLGGAIANMSVIYVSALTGITGMVIDDTLYQYTGGGNRWVWLGTTMDYTTWLTNNSNDANSPARANPLFVNPSAYDFALQAGSPAIDQGSVIAGITDGYMGSAPDLGYKEKA